MPVSVVRMLWIMCISLLNLPRNIPSSARPTSTASKMRLRSRFSSLLTLPRNSRFFSDLSTSSSCRSRSQSWFCLYSIRRSRRDVNLLRIWNEECELRKDTKLGYPEGLAWDVALLATGCLSWSSQSASSYGVVPLLPGATVDILVGRTLQKRRLIFCMQF